MRWKECAIVDDNKFDRLICNKILQRIDSDLKIGEFQSGKEILCYLKERDATTDPLLILLDLNMPEMSGHEFLEHISADESMSERLESVRIAIITSSTRSEDRERSMSFRHVIDFLQKPILIAQMEQLLSNPASDDDSDVRSGSRG